MSQLKQPSSVAQYTAIYDPHLLSPQDFIAGFVARHETLTFFIKLLKGKCGGSCHQLILGARGMGKTSMLRRIAMAIAEEESLAKTWIPITFREEQYNVSQLRFFWKNTCDSLAQWCEERGDDINARLLDDLQEQSSVAADDYLQAIEQVIAKHKRRLVLLVDNLNLILENLSAADQWALRKVLSSRSGPVMIAASSTTIDSLSEKDEAFYDFFHLEDLAPLNEIELRQCLVNIARQRGKPGKEVIIDMDKNPARLKVIHTYTDGNPRTLVLMYRVLESICGVSDSTSNDFMPLLTSLIESVTPLYKARTEELPSQQRQIIDALALAWDPQTAASVAEKTGLPATSLPQQLKRLRADGVIQDVTMANRKKGLQLRERFYNIWYLMRNGSRRGKRRLIFLTRSIEDLFTENERKEFGMNFLGQATIEPEYGLAIAGAMNAEINRKILTRIFDNIDSSVPEDTRKEVIDALNTLGLKSKNDGDFTSAIADFTKVIELLGAPADQRANALIDRGFSFDKQGDHNAAIADFTAVVDLPKAPVDRVAMALLLRGLYIGQQREYETAIADFTGVIELPRAPVDLISLALFIRGVTLEQIEDSNSAIDDFTALIELSGASVEHIARALVNRGDIFKQQRNMDSAFSDYTAVIELPEAPVEQVAMALVNRGIVHDKKDLDLAIADYTAAIDLSSLPVDLFSKALVLRGNSLVDKGSIDSAISDFNLAINIPEAPADLIAKALLMRATTIGKQGDVGAAIADLTAVIELPEAPVDLIAIALVLRGNVFRYQGDLDSEIADFTAVINLPDAPIDQIATALNLRGVTIGQQGDSNAAINDYTAAIDLPKAPGVQIANALFNRAFEYKKQLIVDRSIQDLQLALGAGTEEFITNTFAYWNLLGGLYLDHTGHSQQAHYAFLEGLKTGNNPEMDYINANLIWYYIASNDIDSAIKQRNSIDQLSQVGLELIDSAIAIATDNFGLAIDYLQKALEADDPDLWTTFKDDLLRLVRLMKKSDYGEKLLEWMRGQNLMLKHAAFYHAVEAYVLSDDLLKNINPETRKISQPMYDWLVLDNVDITDLVSYKADGGIK